MSTAEANVTALVPHQGGTVPAPARREVRVVSDPIPVLDTARFEHMQRVANVMAGCSLIPDALCKFKTKNEQGQDVMAWMDDRQIAANCFMVVNQSVRWGMDPFAVAQCVSVVHGRLCYEGKLIAAVISAKLGYNLEYEISGQGDAMKVVVSAAENGKPVLDSKGQPKTVEGTVADWKTTNSGSPWAARGGHARMLRYRGAREWCRVHAPALMLGVYSDDEMEVLSENDRRGYAARDVTPGNEQPAAIAGPRRAPPPPGHAEAAETTQVVESPTTAPEEAKQDEIKSEETKQDEAKADAAPVGETQKAAPTQASNGARRAPPPPQAKPAQEDENLDIPGFLRGEQTPKDEPKQAEASTAEAPSNRDVKAFLAWADTKLAAIPIQFADAFESIVDGEIRPRAEGMFPPDLEELEGLIRKHEQRLNG